MLQFYILLGIFEAEKAKRYFMAFIRKIHESEIEKYVKEFYEKRMSKIFYVDAINTIKRLKNEGLKYI